MMEWGSSTTLAHSQNSPNNANNIVQQTHSPSINSNSINETDGKTKNFFSKEENACYLESAKDNGVLGLKRDIHPLCTIGTSEFEN